MFDFFGKTEIKFYNGTSLNHFDFLDTRSAKPGVPGPTFVSSGSTFVYYWSVEENNRFWVKQVMTGYFNSGVPTYPTTGMLTGKNYDETYGLVF